jgi:hypothetical protein
MVAELAVFGAIGTTAGLISSLTTTVETLNKKYHDLAEGADRLDYCRSRIIVIEQDLRNWRNTWYDTHQKPYPNTTYQLFWGQGGFKEVKKMLMRIKKEDESIQTFLYCRATDSPKVSDSQERYWRQILDELSSEREHVSCEDGWLRKLIYALFQGSYLKECIDRLKDEVELLEKFSRKEYWMRLNENLDANKWIDPKELKTNNDFQVQLTDIVEKMEIMYKMEQDSGKWTLVLGKPPPDETLRNLADGLGFQLDFVTQHSDKYQIMTVEIDAAQSACSKETDFVRNVSFEGLGVELSIKGLLEKILADANLRKVRESTLAIVATNLVKSIVLLYKAPWTRDLCTCGILIADTMEMEKDICTFRKRPGKCHDRTTEEQRFLRLAVALAELCLGTPIKPISFQEKQYDFEVCAFESLSTAQSKRRDIEQIGIEHWRRVQEAELLRMVQKQTGSRAYKLALESCLALSRFERLDDTAVRPEHIRRSPEDIVKP